MLYQNDDFGKDYLIGLREGLGDKADKMIVATQSYETTDPTIDSQILSLREAAPMFCSPQLSPNSPRRLSAKSTTSAGSRCTSSTYVSSSVGSVMRPAGPEKAMGIISAAFVKDPTDPQWQDTPEYKEWLAWMKKYNASANVSDDLHCLRLLA